MNSESASSPFLLWSKHRRLNYLDRFILVWELQFLMSFDADVPPWPSPHIVHFFLYSSEEICHTKYIEVLHMCYNSDNRNVLIIRRPDRSVCVHLGPALIWYSFDHVLHPPSHWRQGSGGLVPVNTELLFVGIGLRCSWPLTCKPAGWTKGH